MDGCVLVCSKCNISSPYGVTITLAQRAFKLLIRRVRSKVGKDFEYIDFGERMPDPGSHGEEDNESFANEPGGPDVPYDKEPED